VPAIMVRMFELFQTVVTVALSAIVGGQVALTRTRRLQRTIEATISLRDRFPGRITGRCASKTDTINKALQVFAYLQELQRGGGAIYVREPGSKEQERLKIF